jgi:hypothetical protein
MAQARSEEARNGRERAREEDERDCVPPVRLAYDATAIGMLMDRGIEVSEAGRRQSQSASGPTPALPPRARKRRRSCSGNRRRKRSGNRAAPPPRALARRPPWRTAAPHPPVPPLHPNRHSNHLRRRLLAPALLPAHPTKGRGTKTTATGDSQSGGDWLCRANQCPADYKPGSRKRRNGSTGGVRTVA